MPSLKKIEDKTSRLEPEQVHAILLHKDSDKLNNLSFVVYQAETPWQLLDFFNLLNELKYNSSVFKRFREDVPDDAKRQDIIASPNRGALRELVAKTGQVFPENFYDDVEQIINVINKLQTFYPELGDNTLEAVNEVIEKLQGNDPIISVAVCVGNCSKESDYANGALHWVGFTLHRENLYFADSFLSTFEKLVSITPAVYKSYLGFFKYLVRDDLKSLNKEFELLGNKETTEAKKTKALEDAVSCIYDKLIPKLTSYLADNENEGVKKLLEQFTQVSIFNNPLSFELLKKFVDNYKKLLVKDNYRLYNNLIIFLREKHLVEEGRFPVSDLSNVGFDAKLKEMVHEAMCRYIGVASFNVSDMHANKPQQSDGFSCGYHTIMNLRSHLDAIAEGKEFSEFVWHSNSNQENLIARIQAEANQGDAYTSLSSLQEIAKKDDVDNGDNNVFMLGIIAAYAFIFGSILASSGVYVLVFIVGLVLAYVYLNQDVLFYAGVTEINHGKDAVDPTNSREIFFKQDVKQEVKQDVQHSGDLKSPSEGAISLPNKVKPTQSRHYAGHGSVCPAKHSEERSISPSEKFVPASSKIPGIKVY